MRNGAKIYYQGYGTRATWRLVTPGWPDYKSAVQTIADLLRGGYRVEIR